MLSFPLLVKAATSPDALITISQNEMTIKRLISEIENQTGYLVVFSNDDMNTNHVVNLKRGAATVKDVLTDALNQANIDFLFDNNYIVLKKGSSSETLSVAQQSQNKVTGVVKDEAGEPIIGASILALKSNKIVLADTDGSFSIEAEQGETLRVSFIGYQTVEVTVINQQPLSITLFEDGETLEAAVVTGYGNINKSAYTGAATVLSTDDIKDVPVISVAQMLEAQVPGLKVSSTSGQAGANKSMTIRGIGSINASNMPLIVLDGIPIISGDMSNDSDNNAGLDALSTINPNDIESMTILKDATSTALYGARGSNGVINIVTKKGKVGKTRVSFKSSFNFSDFATKYRPVMGGEERRELIYEGYVNERLENGYTEAQAISYADGKIDNYAAMPVNGWADWKDAMFQTAFQQNYDVSVSGGTGGTTFAASLGYTDNNGNTLSSGFERYTGRVSVNHVVNKFDLAVSAMFSQTENSPALENYYYASPIYGITTTLTPSNPIYNPDGTFNTNLSGNNNYNPLLEDQETEKYTRISHFLGSAGVGYKIIDQLKVSTTLGVEYSGTKDFKYWSPDSRDGASVKGAGMYWSPSVLQIKTDTRLIFTEVFGNHRLNFTAGFESYARDYEFMYMRGEGYGQKTNHDISNTANPILTRQYTENDRQLSVIGFLNYDYKDKYYFTATYRRDGSSRLNPDHRWANFWSLSGSWRITHEPFMNSLKSWLTDLKLRASYGVNGTLPGGWYSYMYMYSSAERYSGNSAIRESNLGYDRLSWEKGYNANIGVDLTLFGKIMLDLSFYQRDTKDLLMDKPIYAAVGLYSKITNVGHFRNRGFEIDITSNNMRKKDFRWTTSLNLSSNKSKVIRTDENNADLFSSYRIHRVGLPFNTLYVIESAGVDPDNGKMQYYYNTDGVDANGEPLKRQLTYDVRQAARTPLKDADPNLSGGLTNTFSYKFIDLSFMLSFTLGGYSLDQEMWAAQDDGYRDYYNKSTELRRRWQKPGDITDVPRYVNGYMHGGYYTTSRAIHSTDHLRLKNISVGARMPEKWLKAVRLESARVFFSGSNLLTWAAYDQYDPELGTVVGIGIPPMKTFSFGIEVGF
ncbi:MAG: TonB-dependent receptor [Prevotellaceae bacterium]|nr:TonB-dependent receptor [Prevotellaceae bacterium]